MNQEEKPLLRSLDVVPLKWQGRPSLVLRDPLGYCEGYLVVPQVLAPVLALMDGRHGLRDLQVAASRALGRLVMMEEVVALVKELDKRGFLQNETFFRIKERVEEEWRYSPIRRASHAGKSYPADERELKDFLRKVLGEVVRDERCPRVLVAPHLDISSGARTFSEAYRRFPVKKGARVILAGTGHQLDHPFSVLTKSMETPLGVVSVDREFVKALSERVPQLFFDHFSHKNEHSLEFQLVFLRYLCDDFSVVPILFGPLEGSDSSEFLSLAKAVAELFDEDTYLVLGVDFSHLGIRYGDPFPAGPNEAEAALKADRRVLEVLFSADPALFLKEAEAVKEYKICGITALYFACLLLKELGRNFKAEVFRQEAVPFGTGSIVSIAAAGIFWD